MGEYMHIVTENLGVGMVMRGEEPQKRDVFCRMIQEFTDHLGIGPINQYVFASQERKQWLSEILTVRGTDYDFEVEDVVENLLLPIKMDEIAADQKIVIWHADNVRDQLALRYLVSEYGDYPLYEANVSQHILRQEEDKTEYVKTILECTQDQMSESFKEFVAISDERKAMLQQEWEELKTRTSVLRVLKDGQIVDLEETAYDQAIQDAVDSEEAYPIQQIMRDVNRKAREDGDVPSKLWLEYRIQKMVAEGVLVAEDESPNLGLVKVKKQ
ncbi:MAG: DUF3658 domain-containing protein [Cellulosilyticaceae bacterium]